MPAQAIASSILFAEGASFAAFTIGISLLAAGALDAYILGKILAPTAKDADLGSQNLTIRSAAGSHKVIYGRSMVGGTAILVDVLDRYSLKILQTRTNITLKETRDSGDYLNVAVAIAAHEIDGVEEVWIGEDRVFAVDGATGKLILVNQKYKDKIEVSVFTGRQTSADSFIQSNIDRHYDGISASDATVKDYYTPLGVTAVNAVGNTITIDSNLTYNTNTLESYDYEYHTGGDGGDYTTISGALGAPGGEVHAYYENTFAGHTVPPQGKPWNANYKLINTAYVYCRFKYDPDLYSGLPNIRTVIRGKRVFDPRYSEANLTMVNRGTWAQSTVYAVNDKIVLSTDTTKVFVCAIAHTSENTPYNISVFYNDFIVNNYWKRVQVNDDPDTWEWSDNWALCNRDYLTSGNYHSVKANGGYTKPVNLYGVGVKETEIDEANIIEAANVSDEVVYLEAASQTVVFNSYNSFNNRMTIAVTGDITEYYSKYEHILVTTAVGANLFYNSLIAFISHFSGFNIGNTIDSSFLSETVSSSPIKLESSYYDLDTNRTVLSFLSPSSVTVTEIRLWSRKFTTNGLVDTASTPISVMEALLAAGAGTMPYVQGKFLLIPGVYQTPTISINESNLAGDISVQGSQGSSNLINTISGTIRDPANYWEETDFFAQTHVDYVTADGGYELSESVKYAFTTSNFDAQRLARISLQRSREGVSASLICNLSVLELSVGQFIYVSIDRLGWTNKIFSITSWTLEGTKILLGIREENSVAYDWDDTKLTSIKYSPDTDFIVAPELLPVTGLTLASGTAHLISLADGTIVPRVYASWTAAGQEFQTKYLIEYLVKPFNVNDDELQAHTARIEDVSTEEFYIDNVREGDSVTFSIYTIYDNINLQYKSARAKIISHIVVGKTAPPIDVTGLAYNILEDLLVLNWDANTEIDFSHYEIKVGASWAAGTPVGTTTNNEFIVTGINISTNTYWIKAFDTSGNESALADSVPVTISVPGTISSVNYTIEESNILLSWPASVATDFPVASYVISQGGNPVADVDSTDYIITSKFVGLRTYQVIPKDIYGNAGLPTVKNITIAIPSAPSISTHTLNSDKVEFTWTTAINTLTQFPIEVYETAYGTDPVWDNNTPILTTATSGFSKRVDWLNSVDASRTFRVRAVDKQGNKSAASVVPVTITSPGSTNISNQVIDNNVLLTWPALSITPNVNLPIAYYEVRKGATYGASTSIGNISGLFSAIFENNAGTFTYWVTGYDTAGNPGTNNSTTASVNQPPDYTLLISAADDFSTIDSYFLSRTLINAYLTGDNKIAVPVNLTETWTDHFVNNAWTDIEDQQTAGFPIYAQPTPASGSYEVLYDTGALATNLSVTVTLTKEIIAGDPIATLKVYTSVFNTAPTGTNDTLDAAGIVLIDTTAAFLTTASIGSIVTNDTDVSSGTILSVDSNTQITLAGLGLAGGTNNEWQVSDTYSIDNYLLRGTTTTDSITSFVTTFQYIKVLVDVASSANDTDIYELGNLDIVVDVKEKTDAGTGTTGADPDNTATVNFTKSFLDITSIIVTPKLTEGKYSIAVYDFVDTPNPTSFTVYTYDQSTGAEAYGIDFSWVARGY